MKDDIHKEIKSYSMLFEGIHIDNANLFIPWNTKFSDLKNYGNSIYSRSSNQTDSNIYEQYLWEGIELLGIELSTFGIGRTIKETNCELLDSFHGWVKGLTFNSHNLVNDFNDSITRFASDNQIFIASEVRLESGFWTLKNIELSLYENDKLQRFEFMINKVK